MAAANALITADVLNYGSTSHSEIEETSTLVDEENVSTLISEKRTSMKQELKTICRTSAPLSVTFFLQYSLPVASTFSVGHISAKHLAAVSLATMTFNVTSSIFNGMATCLDTLCPAAFGAGKYKKVGLYFQRCILLMMTLNIFIVLFWWNSGIFFRLFVKDSSLVALAQGYLRVMTFCTPAYILFEAGKRYLQAQNIFVAGQYALFIAAPINAFLNYALVWSKHFNLGFLGAPLGTTISYWILPTYLFYYSRMHSTDKCWAQPNVKAIFRDLKPMASLAINGTAMLLLEFIAFEILTLCSATFGTETLAAQSICSTLATLFFQIPFAASVASSTRISNLIGETNQRSAKIATKATYILSLALGVLNFCVLFFFRKQIAMVFTNDATVIGIAKGVIGILGLNQFWDAPNILGAGCLRAQARQQVGSKLNVIAYYIIGLPISLFLGFKMDLEIVGLWIGLLCGVFSLACSEFVCVFLTDWKSVIREAENRNKNRENSTI